MRLLSDILRRGFIDPAYNAVEEARLGIRRLTGNDMNKLLSYQVRTDAKGPLNAPVWLLSSYGPACGPLEELATKLCKEHRSESEESIVEFALPQALTFLLRRTGPVVREALLEEAFRTDSLRLRFSAADYLINSNREEEGLRRIIDLIPLLDRDHAIADAIPMYFTKYCPPGLERRLLDEANSAIRDGHEAIGADILWAISSTSTRDTRDGNSDY